uniref:Midasin n=1 Tax=Anthurium amnicola TaxID=1678845 RepID=A0A1D1XHG4_9ARAE
MFLSQSKCSTNITYFDCHIYSFHFQPAVIEITNEEKLHLFVHSYDLGTRIIKGLPSTISAALDEKLVVEQMLRVCLESEGDMSLFQQPAHTFNIYKDPNASMMSKMVEPLLIVQERVKYLLNEWSDHPALQNILRVTEMLLSIPLNTSLFKGLFGLESLIARVHSLQETSPKFSLSDCLEPIYSLVYSWQKIELDSWSNFLDGVEEEYEINAGKLWFPLRSVLHRNLSGDSDLDNISTVQSVEEFMQTSCLGEFKKRLQLLLAFHGQFNAGISLNVCLSPHQKEILNILYNAFGFYIQFLPLVIKHVKADRRCKEEEIKNQIKLLKWEHPNALLSIEKFRVARHKLWKLIKKFNDCLQQPLMVFLNHETNLKNSEVAAWFKQKPCVEPDSEPMPFPIEPTHFGATERLLRHHGWGEKLSVAFEAYYISGSSGNDAMQCKEFASSLRLSLFSKCDGLFSSSSKGWVSLEKIYGHATDFARTWKHGTKNLKKRSLVDLMKILETSGLSRHRSLITEIEAGSNQPSTLFLQPSYNMQHLLLKDSNSSSDYINVHEMLSSGSFDLKWKMANQYYFKNIAMLQQLQLARLNFHKDLSLELVNRSMSFIDHLIKIQQDQRSLLYALSEQFKKLRRHSSSLENIGTVEISISSDQHVLFQCMWKQKKLFDMLVTLSRDVSLLLRCIGNSHLNACHGVKGEAEMLSSFIDKHVQSFVKSKESLDKCLLGVAGVVTPFVVCNTPFIILKQMEVLIMQNFEIINSLDNDIQLFSKSKAFKRSVDGLLLGRFRALTTKGKLIEKEFLSLAAANSCQADDSYKKIFVKLDASFTLSSAKTINMVKDSIGKLDLLYKELTSFEDIPTEKITSWNVIFEKYVSALQLGLIYESFNETIISAGKLLNHAGNKDSVVCAKVEIQLKHLHVLLDLFLSIGEAISLDFLAVHNAMVEMSHMLAQIFALLFSEGFGDLEEPVDDTSHISQDATGTGMGEGEGLNDVSDQISDEAQLLGTSQKQNQVPENSDKVPSKTDKGIEMEEDFTADLFSVSEDSGDDVSEEEDINLESGMGQNVDSSQVIDEKLWDKEEDVDVSENVEKYELGPAVKEMDPSCREFRGREDPASDIDGSGELTDEDERLSGKAEDANVSDDEQSVADAKMNESQAFEDSSGIQFDKQKQNLEELSMDEAEDSVALDERIDENMKDESSQTNTKEDHMDVKESVEVERFESNEGDKSNEKDADMDMMGTASELVDLEKTEPKSDPSLESGSLEHVHNSFAADLNMMPEAPWSNNHDLQKSFVLSSGLPSDIPRSESSLPELRHGEMFAGDQSKLQSSEDHSSSLQRSASNPYRSIGDAMEEWKDRVKISVDSEEHQSDVPDHTEDGVGDEYQFVSEMEKGSSQTLGPATSDQVTQSIDRKDPTLDGHMNEDDTEHMEKMKEYSEREYIKRGETSISRQKPNEQSVRQLSDTGLRNDAPLEGFKRDSSIDELGGFVSFESSSTRDQPFQSSDLNCDQTIHQMEMDNASDGMKYDSIVDWKRYERLTMSLSQELCEQLRLVMEPTLASKLQGDYKTGKRINMKKVIPYIASHFRKDKIWLRRTRPNKRDYQVVVAIDDSRSMSESHCGNVAIEALVTICRAMTQLEVGQFAVASFGEKGNIRLLHDFGQPFTGETGIKMISSLSFNQDNTIRDEPVADLLKYLDKMLDTAVARARLPSGINPLKQLILIIADGRFQDKEKLRRCVRDILNKKRLIAFVLLDNPQESIMDLPEYSFVGGKFSCTKYMDTFPFPYYVALRNIEALPRTLADLLRQWFQLMQSAKE